LGLSLQVDPVALRPIIEAVVSETLSQLETERAKLAGQLAFPEAHAARLIGLNPHQLRDERIRGRIEASVGPGRRVLYTREQLLQYLLSRRWVNQNGQG
jgi:hypothetical protein